MVRQTTTFTQAKPHPDHAGSLQIAFKTNPTSTTTLTNSSATNVGVGGVDSAAILSSITAEDLHNWVDEMVGWFITSVWKATSKRGSHRPQKTRNNQSGCGLGYWWSETTKNKQQSSVNEGWEMWKSHNNYLSLQPPGMETRMQQSTKYAND